MKQTYILRTIVHDSSLFYPPFVTQGIQLTIINRIRKSGHRQIYNRASFASSRIHTVFRNRASKRISMLARAWLAHCIIISGQPTTVYTLYSELPQVHCRRRNSNINVTCNRNSEPISNAIARALNLSPRPSLLFFHSSCMFRGVCIHGVPTWIG